jgi:hypothetical protein
MDRLIFVGLYRLVPNIIKALTIVKPEPHHGCASQICLLQRSSSPPRS